MNNKIDKLNFWKLTLAEVVLYILMLVLTSVCIPIMIVLTIFTLVSGDPHTFLIIGVPILVFMLLQNTMLIYPNIKRAKELTKVNSVTFIVNLFKLMAKTLLFQTVINVVIVSCAVIIMYNN